MTFEQLASNSLIADTELQRLQVSLRQLEHKFGREGPELHCNDYLQLQAAVAQTRQRLELAEQKAANARAALDAARTIEQDREQKELSERRYAARVNDFENAKAKLMANREQIATLNRETPLLERAFNQALAALAKGTV